MNELLNPNQEIRKPLSFISVNAVDKIIYLDGKREIKFDTENPYHFWAWQIFHALSANPNKPSRAADLFPNINTNNHIYNACIAAGINTLNSMLSPDLTQDPILDIKKGFQLEEPYFKYENFYSLNARICVVKN